jgi:hypothetical protein
VRTTDAVVHADEGLIEHQRQRPGDQCYRLQGSTHPGTYACITRCEHRTDKDRAPFV